MAEIKSVSPEEAQRLVSQGYVYVDVRSEPEFVDGHAPGALNVPLLHATGAGMVPNPEFLAVIQGAFGKAEKLVIGCKAGGRSRKAAELLSQAGYTDISDMPAGFEGGRDPFGRPLPGWRQSALPIETGNTGGQTYADVKGRSPR